MDTRTEVMINGKFYHEWYLFEDCVRSINPPHEGYAWDDSDQTFFSSIIFANKVFLTSTGPGIKSFMDTKNRRYAHFASISTEHTIPVSGHSKFILAERGFSIDQKFVTRKLKNVHKITRRK